MAIDFFDFFSGCGGTSLGMRRAGLSLRLAVDIDSDSAQTYKQNFKRVPFLERDIVQLEPGDIAPFLRSEKVSVKVFGACAPCQPFSTQNPFGAKGDKRVPLLTELHKFIEAFQPEYIFLENVPGLQSVKGPKGPFLPFMRLLDRMGYDYDYDVVAASDFGVPQHRKRLVLLGSRLGKIQLPKATHGTSPGLKPLATVWEHIGKLPPISAGECHKKIPNHQAANLSELNLARLSATPIGGGRQSWPDELRLECHKNHSGHTDVYGRMIMDQPASALTTRCISLSNGRFGHPKQNRAISIREAACLQTFPMDFVFHGTLNSMARQVGNAVPVLMSEAMGKTIVNHYRRHKRRAKKK